MGRAERIEAAARALLVQVVSQRHASGPIEGMVATSPERLQAAADNLRAALALPADAPEGAGEPVAWRNVEAALREWEGRVVIRAKMEEAKEGGIAYAREQESRALMVALNAIHAYAAHPTPRAEAAPSHTDLMVTPESVGPYVAAEAYAQGVIDGQQHERALAIAPASAEAVAREAADLLAEMDAAWPPSQPPPHPKSFQGRFQARVRAVAHALRACKAGGA